MKKSALYALRICVFLWILLGGFVVAPYGAWRLYEHYAVKPQQVDMSPPAQPKGDIFDEVQREEQQPCKP